MPPTRARASPACNPRGCFRIRAPATPVQFHVRPLQPLMQLFVFASLYAAASQCSSILQVSKRARPVLDSSLQELPETSWRVPGLQWVGTHSLADLLQECRNRDSATTNAKLLSSHNKWAHC